MKITPWRLSINKRLQPAVVWIKIRKRFSVEVTKSTNWTCTTKAHILTHYIFFCFTYKKNGWQKDMLLFFRLGVRCLTISWLRAVTSLSPVVIVRLPGNQQSYQKLNSPSAGCSHSVCAGDMCSINLGWSITLKGQINYQFKKWHSGDCWTCPIFRAWLI